jgi:small-conductance mechanosensitive channel
MSEFLDRVLFVVGGTPVTVESVAVLAGIVIVSYVVSRLLQRAVRRWVKARPNIDRGAANTSLKLLHYLVIGLGAAVGLDTIGVDLGTLFAAGAVVAVAIGFAMQNITQNFVSGLILLTERSITEEDILEVEGNMVFIERLGTRATVARTRDDEQLIIPNATIVQSTVKNYTLADDVTRIRTQVGVHYESDVDLVFQVLTETAMAGGNRIQDRDPVVLLLEFGDSSIVFEVSIWIQDPWQMRRARSDLNHAIWRALKENHITIAFPQLDLHVKEAPDVGARVSEA